VGGVPRALVFSFLVVGSVHGEQPQPQALGLPAAGLASQGEHRRARDDAAPTDLDDMTGMLQSPPTCSDHPQQH
jgi:hypothetical protein